MRLNLRSPVTLICFTFALSYCGQTRSPQNTSQPTSLKSCQSGIFTTDWNVNARNGDGIVEKLIPQSTALSLTGEAKIMTVNSTDYEFCKTSENLWIAKDFLSADVPQNDSTIEGTYTDANTYIHVNLTTQMITVMQAGTVIMKETVSTGKPQYQTCTGVFYIGTRNREQTMRSPFPQDPYSIYTEFVQYFDGAMAFHSADHDYFGYNVSHGCVNMRKASAEVLWNYYVESKKNGVNPRVVIDGVSPGVNPAYQCTHKR